MKNITLAVITALKANTAVAAKVGTRIYRGTVPPSPTYPLIVATRIDNAGSENTSSSTYVTARIQCTVMTATTEVAGVSTPGDAEAEVISDLIKKAVCYTATSEGIQNTLVNGVYISDIDDAGSVPDNSDGLTLKIWREHRDLMVTYLDD
jgi:hypothetical protein